MTCARGPFRRALRRIASLLVVAAVTPLGLAALIVVALRWVPPPTTAFMLQHRLESGEWGSRSEHRAIGGSTGAR